MVIEQNDITIESGDVIVIGAASKFINITGMVKRPGTYEVFLARIYLIY